MPWRTPADKRVLNYLSESIRRGRVAHSYLLAGPTGVGVGSLAQELSQAILCDKEDRPCGSCRPCARVVAGNHADYFVVTASGPSLTIGIDEVRELKVLSSLEPYEGRRKVFVIDGAETMTADASNALLKLLEEPPPKVVLVMTTVDEDSVSETIRSRCQTLRLSPLPYRDVADALVTNGVDEEEAEQIALMSSGRIELARTIVEEPKYGEERAEAWDNLLALVGMHATDRLKLAARLADGFFRDRETLFERLGLWETLWREVLLREAGVGESVARSGIEADALSGIGVQRARDAIATVRFTIDALRRNANPRLAVEALVLKMPYERPAADAETDPD